MRGVWTFFLHLNVLLAGISLEEKGHFLVAMFNEVGF